MSTLLEQATVDAGGHLTQPIHAGGALFAHLGGQTGLVFMDLGLLVWETVHDLTPPLADKLLGNLRYDAAIAHHKRGRGQSPYGMPPVLLSVIRASSDRRDRRC